MTIKGQSYYTCPQGDIQNNSCAQLVKLNSASALGQCLPEGRPSEISDLFRRNKINVFTGNSPRRRGLASNKRPLSDNNDDRVIALAKVVEAFDRMGGGKLRALKDGENIDVVFAGANSRARNSRRVGSEIQITGGAQNMSGTMHTSECNGMDNHGLIAHELGHYIAGNNNDQIMNQYNEAMASSRCDISNYASKNKSEEIAEVIAAYVTAPQLFLEKGEGCTKAFAFMKTIFSEPNMQMTCEARRNSYNSRPMRMAEEMQNPRNRDRQNSVF